MNDLTDEQWCILDVLVRARKAGVSVVSRRELLESNALPAGVRVKLVMAALLMPGNLIEHVGSDFAITPEGVDAYNLRFGHGANPEPTEMADHIIYLPGPVHGVPS
jgi:hypothetical protein